MISPVELDVQRTLTAEFIAADRISVAIVRPQFADDGAGGRMRVGTVTLPAQDFRLIPLGDGASERLTLDGLRVTPSYMLMGEHTTDLARWDEFEVGGRRYQIVFVNENRQYQVKGEAIFLV